MLRMANLHSTYHGPGGVPGTSHMGTHLAIPASLAGRYWYSLHFTYKNTEAQRGQVTPKVIKLGSSGLEI